jgi:deoxyhypusine synthase
MRRASASSRTSSSTSSCAGSCGSVDFQIDRDSWLVAAAEKNLPMFVPGWEDSTLGNIFVAHVARVTSSLHDRAFRHRVHGRPDASGTAEGRPHEDPGVGFFQIGGGIAGDFPICVVPLMHQDLQRGGAPTGAISARSASSTSYGSYSGAVPNEKITWGKLAPDTPSSSSSRTRPSWRR